MSTRGCIAKIQENGWIGRINWCDSYPSGLGKQIWDILHSEKFNGNLELFIKFAFDEHKSGWISFPDNCYCHNDDEETESIISDKDSNALFIEWVYILDQEHNKIIILTNEQSNHEHKEIIGEKNILYKVADDNCCVYSYSVFHHKYLATIDLNDEEPNWEKI